MTQKKFYEDTYQKSINATIVELDAEKGVRLDATIFFPESSTEFGDMGTLNGIKVIPTRFDDEIWHIPSDPNEIARFVVGEKVSCEIDFNRRMLLLRRHSALHLLANILGDMGLYPAGGQVHQDETYLIMREVIDDALIPMVIQKANEIISENRLIKTYESEERAGFRYMQIDGFSAIPCGGVHLKSLGLIGKIKLVEVRIRKKKSYIFIDVVEA